MRLLGHFVRNTLCPSSSSIVEHRQGVLFSTSAVPEPLRRTRSQPHLERCYQSRLILTVCLVPATSRHSFLQQHMTRHLESKLDSWNSICFYLLLVNRPGASVTSHRISAWLSHQLAENRRPDRRSLPIDRWREPRPRGVRATGRHQLRVYLPKLSQPAALRHGLSIPLMVRAWHLSSTTYWAASTVVQTFR